MKKQVINFHRPAVRRYAAGLGVVKTGAAVDFGKLVESGAGVTAVMRQELRRAYPRSLGGGIIDLGPAHISSSPLVLTPQDIDKLLLIANGIKSDKVVVVRKNYSKSRLVGIPSSNRNVDIALGDILGKVRGAAVERFRFSDNTRDMDDYGSDDVDLRGHYILLASQHDGQTLAAYAIAVIQLARFVNNHRDLATIDPDFSKGAHAYASVGSSSGATVTISYHIPFDREAYNRHLATQRQKEEHETYVAEQNRLEATADAETSAKRLEEAVSKNETLKVQTSTGIRRTLLWAGAAAVAVALLAAAVVVVKKHKK